jgi:hypothetical protein
VIVRYKQERESEDASTLDKGSALSGQLSTHQGGYPSARGSDGVDVVPFSSSFFGGRLLNCLHHEVRSRRDEAGSGVAIGAGWGSPLRTRGVWGLLCVPTGGMAGWLRSVAALQTTMSRAKVDRSVSEVGVFQVRVGPQWAGGRRLGAAM